MTCRIEIEFRPEEGAVLRLLGLVERRGYMVRAMTLPSIRAGSTAWLSMDVAPRDAGRRVETVCAQLAKMHDVVCVRAGQDAPALEAAS
ncbi:hypothetical protein F1654_13195 [Alkalicaulis satelles]|uniref:Acetolactate synthase n=1 Tax=Alkalicaulis satelles TaxID=2609175 RepID=A0A5M6Z8N8_9PROT|nr:ACT domain-containing protein [Alkalicaulis satelles]KAA5801009.1 hypothetical protein F1654_13195 [Alkalicaulis satelles]